MSKTHPASLSDSAAEMAVLGGILVEPELLLLLPDIEVDHFATPAHGHVWAAMRNLEAKGKPIDVVSVADQLELDGHLNTPPSLLGECALNVPTPENVAFYADILRRHKIGRDVFQALGSVVAKLSAGETSGPEALVDAQALLAKVETGERDERGKTLASIVLEIVGDFERGEMQPSGIPSGLKKLDAKTGGIPYGVPTLVLAPPGTGKSTLALTLCEGAEGAGDTPLLYSYEDGYRSFGQRVMARHSGIPTEVIRAGAFQRRDLSALAWHRAEILGRRTVVVGASGMGVEELVRDVRMRRLKHKGEGSTGRLVVVDYVQRMPLPKMHQGTKNDRMGEISKRLADLAANEGIAVVLCSQVGRQTAREARPPILQDARDCGELEQDAKLALGLFRPSVYNKPCTGDEGGQVASPSVLEIHVLKNHQGAADCHVEAYWDLETHAIVDSREDLAGRKRTA